MRARFQTNPSMTIKATAATTMPAMVPPERAVLFVSLLEDEDEEEVEVDVVPVEVVVAVADADEAAVPVLLVDVLEAVICRSVSLAECPGSTWHGAFSVFGEPYRDIFDLKSIDGIKGRREDDRVTSGGHGGREDRRCRDDGSIGARESLEAAHSEVVVNLGAGSCTAHRPLTIQHIISSIVRWGRGAGARTLDSRRLSPRRRHVHKQTYSQSGMSMHSKELSEYSWKGRIQKCPSMDQEGKTPRWWSCKSPRHRSKLGSLLETMLMLVLMMG